MQVIHVPCAGFVNASELRAFQGVSGWLRKVDGDAEAYILTNLTHGNPRGQADEIDMVVIGPGGAVVIEVKHWDGAGLRTNSDLDHQAEVITAKAKRVAGQLRSVDSRLEFVPGSILLTREGGALKRNGKVPDRLGVRLYGLKDIDLLLASVAYGGRVPAARLAKALAPRQVGLTGTALRKLARFDQLKLLTPAEDLFARVHSGRDPATGDRVIIHSYDLSAAPSLEPPESSLRRAKREFDAVQRLQKSPYLPSLVDTWQGVPNYAGELFFFTIADSAAASFETMCNDTTWSFVERVAFATNALRALAALQVPTSGGLEGVVHRAINAGNLRVRAGNVALFAGWAWARLPLSQTISGNQILEQLDKYAAPELQHGGLAVATPASDTYSLCKVLTKGFPGEDANNQAVRAALTLGQELESSRRAIPSEIADLIDTADSSGPIQDQLVPPPPSRWDEGYVFGWNGARYRVVALLGKGGMGRTFKLEQLDGDTDDPIGTFVGKVVLNPEIGPTSLAAYRKIRSFVRHDGLSDVLETAATWSPNELMALLRWNRGEPLDAWRGEVQFLADNSGESSVEALLLRWFGDLCAALDVLHVQGWVHGDISPSNILLDDDKVLLIDYDLAGPECHVAATPGTLAYCSPERRSRGSATAADDVFSLAASLFHVATNRTPFASGGSDLSWKDEEREQWPRFVNLLDAAVSTDATQRFETAGAARRRLHADMTTRPSYPSSEAAVVPLRPNVVERAKDILRAYPGSRFGNVETRGLDTEFAANTYVETRLDLSIATAIRTGTVSLVILCGNAGDGKTAFLQHLARSLGIIELPSSRRVWDGNLHGRQVKINLDGAAAWKDRSADELLDELFEPFHSGTPPDKRVHLVAVNDGRLMEWIESYESRKGGSTPLTIHLADTLAHEGGPLEAHVRLIELNERSLVGGLSTNDKRVTTEFVDQLIGLLVGGNAAPEVWLPCRTCTAQARCSMKSSAEMMGASRDPVVLEQGRLFRDRLMDALQAVHQRNEVHITARELKAALSYILFGLYSCEDFHANPELIVHARADYAFDPESPLRQGELLRELTRLDPGLEAHPRIDRYLTGNGAPDSAHGAPRYRDSHGRSIPLRHARRRAFFEWTVDQIEAVSGDKDALGLKNGRRFSEFRDFPLLSDEAKERIKSKLCEGLSRLEVLPDIAFRAGGVVPIRIVPRTPTETAFWVGKPLNQFDLLPEQFDPSDGLETLHRSLALSYTTNGGRIEQLVISLELYALLIDLADGVQILDAFSDDVFANLGVFTQRLAQEDERSLRAWNPADEEAVYEIDIEMRNGGQTVVLRKAEQN